MGNVTKGTVVPAMPPLSTIKDENTRRVVQALVDGWQLRNGMTGREDDRFVRVGELGDRVNNELVRAFSNGGAYGGAGGSGTGLTPGNLSSVIAQLVDRVTNSLAYQKLTERVSLIDAPRGILDTLDQYGNVISQTSTSLTGLTSTVVAQGTRLGAAEAGIVTEGTTRVTSESAISTVINTIWSAMMNQNGAQALIQNGAQTAVTNGASQATVWNQLQSLFYMPNTATPTSVALQDFRQVQTTLNNGYNAQATLRIDANGHIGGFGISATGTATSPPAFDFIVNSDTFAIGTPTRPEQKSAVPFIVNTDPSKPVLALSGDVGIDGNLVVSGTITAGKIANNSLTRPLSGAGSVSVTLEAGQQATVMLFGGANWITSGGPDYVLTVAISGTNGISVSQKGNTSASATTGAMFYNLFGPMTYMFTLDKSVSTTDGSWGGSFLQGVAFLK